MSTYEEMLYFLTPAELLSWRILLNVAFLHPMDKQRKLNIAFVHPDLGIGKIGLSHPIVQVVLKG